MFKAIADASWHIFQVLTKRSRKMKRLLVGNPLRSPAIRLASAAGFPRVPLPNVWLGVSIENDKYTFRADHLRDIPAAVHFLSLEPLLGPVPSLDLDGIDWVIVGGESGPKARPMHPDWVRDIRDRCVAAGVPFLLKGWGGRTPTAGGRELDGRTWDQYPEEG